MRLSIIAIALLTKTWLRSDLLIRNQQVAGSMPAGGSRKFNKIRAIR